MHLLVIIRNKKIKNQTGNTFTRRTFHVVVSWVVRPYNLPQRERERERERRCGPTERRYHFQGDLKILYSFETSVFLSNYSEVGGAFLRNLCTIDGR